jgi:hypothetical protein
MKATGIVVCEPDGGYNRVVNLTNYPAINFSVCPFMMGQQGNIIEHFEVDFVGHTLNDFDGYISPMDRAFCDDVAKQQVFYSNFIRGQVQTPSRPLHVAGASFQISPSKDASATPVKYVIAEITHSTSQKSATKKIIQIERCLWFLQQKTSSQNIEDCVALAIIIGPEDKLRSEVKSHIRTKGSIYPLSCRLFDIGRLGFIENRNTLLNKVAFFGYDVLDVKDRVSDLDVTLTEQISDVKEQVSDVKEQVNLLVKLVIFMMLIILLLCVLLFCFRPLSGQTETNRTEF